MTARRLAITLAALALAGPAVAAEPPAPDCAAVAAKTDPDPLMRFRCATEANLRAMIVDPADLERGRERTPLAGDAAMAAVHRHRLGAPKPLPADVHAAAPLQIEGKIGIDK